MGEAQCGRKKEGPSTTFEFRELSNWPVFGPRESEDKVHFVRKEKKISNEKLWSSSISDSLNYFLAQVEKNKKIDKKFNFEFYKLNKLLVSK